MRSAAASPDSPLAELTMVQPAEVEQVVGAFNQTERSLPAPYDNCTIHGMFEHWADHTPSAPAVAYEVRSRGLNSPFSINLKTAQAGEGNACSAGVTDGVSRSALEGG